MQQNRIERRNKAKFHVGKVLLTIAACCQIISSFADTRGSQGDEFAWDKIKPMGEIKAGYFMFADTNMRKIYDEGGIDVQLSGSYPAWRWLQVYGSVEYLEKHGKSRHGNQATRIWEIPLSLGLKPVFNLCKQVQYYFGVGPRVIIVHQHNLSPYVNKNVTKGTAGVFANTGFNFLFCEGRVFFDIFGEYSYARVNYHPHESYIYGKSVQVGGYTFGGGFGVTF